MNIVCVRIWEFFLRTPSIIQITTSRVHKIQLENYILHTSETNITSKSNKGYTNDKSIRRSNVAEAHASD